MDNSKLIALLRTFSTQELREFKDFIASPFFNKNRDLLLFYSKLRKLAPDFPADKTEKEVFFKTVFPANPYEDKQMHYLMSFLLKLAEQYIGLPGVPAAGDIAGLPYTGFRCAPQSRQAL